MALVSNVRVGAPEVSYTRTPASAFVAGTVQGLAYGVNVSVWEFTDAITNKPNVDDPSTWDWTPAFKAAFDYVAHNANDYSALSPDKGGGCVNIPAVGGQFIYRISSVSVPTDCAVLGYGATVSPFDINASEMCLFRFYGMNKVAGLQIAMNYSLSYTCTIWCRGRNLDFSECAVWFSSNAVIVGDPAWATVAADGWLGDSEISFSNCQFNWCLKTCTVYGFNSIVHFVGGTRVYCNRGSIPSNHPNAAAWAVAPTANVINYGGHVYIVGSLLSTFERGTASLVSRVIAINRQDYQNSFGRFVLEGSHIESSYLFYSPSESVVSQDTITAGLVVHNCQGHVATSGTDYWVNVSTQFKQAIRITGCRFYGTHGVTPTRTRIVNALAARVEIDEASFTNFAGEFKDACNINLPMNKSNVLLTSAFGSAQAIGTGSTTLVMPNNGTTDLVSGSRGYYYTSSTGLFTASVPLRDVQVEVSLRYASPVSTNTVTLDLVVAGATVDTVVAYGAYPRVTLNARYVPKDATFLVRMQGTAAYTLDGSSNCKVSMRASV